MKITMVWRGWPLKKINIWEGGGVKKGIGSKEKKALKFAPFWAISSKTGNAEYIPLL